MKDRISILGAFIWFLAATFFLYEFFLRVFVSTIAEDVIAALSINAQQFAILGAGYYLTYSLMQIPVGILVDRFGSRLLLTIAVFIAALGGFWFAFSYGFISGFLSRCLMGFGSSFAYVCLLVLALNWFPRKHFGFMIGIANFLGAIGPMLAGGPLAFLLRLFDNNWRLILAAIGLLGFGLALIIGFFVRNAPSRQKDDVILLDPNPDPLLSRLKLLCKNPQVWITTLYAGFVYVCLPLLGAYWGTAYLQARGFDRVAAASLSSLLWLGLAIAAPLLGKFSDLLKRRKLPLALAAALGIASSSGIVYWPTPSYVAYGIFFFCSGVASAGQAISFATIAEHVPRKLHATAIGLNNSMVMLFAALLPQVVTFFIQHAAHSTVATDYTLHHFQDGLFLMPIFYFLAFLIAALFSRETFCRQQFEVIKISSSSQK